MILVNGFAWIAQFKLKTKILQKLIFGFQWFLKSECSDATADASANRHQMKWFVWIIPRKCCFDAAGFRRSPKVMVRVKKNPAVSLRKHTEHYFFLITIESNTPIGLGTCIRNGDTVRVNLKQIPASPIFLFDQAPFRRIRSAEPAVNIHNDVHSSHTGMRADVFVCVSVWVCALGLNV